MTTPSICSTELRFDNRRSGNKTAEITSSRAAFHRAWVERVFEPILSALSGRSRKYRTAELAALTDLAVWKILRRDHGLNRKEVEKTLLEMILSLGTR